MELFSSNNNYKLYHGNMLDMLEILRGGEVSSIVTDPPYELNFMGKGWDNSGIAFQKDTWKKCLEVLKPGGYLLAFGGSRTYHRIACAIEDAGFEIRDCIMWLYGSGFPKSMNIGLAIDKKNGVQGQRGVGGFNVGGKGEQDNRKAKLHIGSTTDGSKQPGYSDYKSDLAKKRAGWGTALKPSYEPIIVARKPLEGSCTDNVIKYGVGGINIDECRVESPEVNLNAMQKNFDKMGYHGAKNTEGIPTYNQNGRFPANTILTYGDDDKEEVCSGFPNTKSTDNKRIQKATDRIAQRITNEKVFETGGYNDEGSAARYFYCAKASKRDRDEGLDKEGEKVNDGRNTPIDNPFQRGETLRKNTHPTVKPTDLMQYLVRLVTPNGGTVLDPFNGSGSTGKAVMYENKDRNKNYKYIGIELTDEYLPIAKARIEYAINVVEEDSKELDKQPTLFDI